MTTASALQSLLPKWLAEPVVVSPDVADGRPLDELAHLLDARLLAALQTRGLQTLFPVQTALLANPPRGDVCVAAPTGSGKTLAYLLPILQALSRRRVTCLRALIVVPGRELAQQVYDGVLPLAAALDLEVGLAVGQSSFSAEQQRLVADPLAVSRGGAGRERNTNRGVDILVATPGRLTDHLQQTAGFTVEHLQWLVLDEADRLLEDAVLDSSFLPLLLKAAAATNISSGSGSSSNNCSDPAPRLRSFRAAEDVPIGSPFWVTPLKKMLLSATLTRDPAKLAELRLDNPTFFKAGGAATIAPRPSPPAADNDAEPDSDDDDIDTAYETPRELQEFLYICSDGKKPIPLIYLLRVEGLTRALCFTSSVETARRLGVLLQRACPTSRIASFTGELGTLSRRDMLRRFNEGELDLLVCSDAAARGLDLQQVSAVINYDAPHHARTYVHRVGRTARAGRPGTAYTIVAIREAYHFRELLRKMGKPADTMPVLRMPDETFEQLALVCRAALNNEDPAGDLAVMPSAASVAP